MSKEHLVVDDLAAMARPCPSAVRRARRRVLRTVSDDGDRRVALERLALVERSLTAEALLYAPARSRKRQWLLGGAGAAVVASVLVLTGTLAHVVDSPWRELLGIGIAGTVTALTMGRTC